MLFEFILVILARILPATTLTWFLLYLLYKKIYKRGFATKTIFLSFLSAWIASFSITLTITIINSKDAAYHLHLGYSALISLVCVFLWSLIDERYKWYEAENERRKVNKKNKPAIVGTSGFTELMFVAREGNLATCKQLIEEGCDVNQRDDYGATALIYSVLSNNVEVVRLLLSMGADPDIATHKGLKPITIAENNKLKPIIEILSNS